MRYIPFMVIFSVFVSSCQSPQQQAENQTNDEQYCKSIGAAGNAFAQCMMYKDQARSDDRQRRIQNFQAANAQLQAHLAAQQAQGQAMMPKVVNTNCRRDLYGNVNCVSY